MIGKNTAEQIDPTIEDSYWRTNYKNRPYAATDHTCDDYSPAYRTGYEGYGNYSQQDLTYDQAEPRLKEDYEWQYSGHRLGWDSARHASRDAWDRVDRNNIRYKSEDDYWRTNFSSRPYREADYTYDDYSPAYRTGYEGYSTYADQGLTFSQAEPHLRRDYERRSANGRLGWDKAKHAIQDAWHRLESSVTDDSTDRRDDRDRRVDPGYGVNVDQRSSYDRGIDSRGNNDRSIGNTPRPDSGTADML